MNGNGPVVVLVGPPGSGKTTIGRKLARRLAADFADTDALIEAEQERTIPEIFAELGESHFRGVEERVIADALDNGSGVLSLGGGAVLSDRTRDALRGRRVVHLTLGVAEGVRRSRGPHRPLLATGNATAKYQRMLTERSPLYRDVAWRTVSTERRSSGKVIREILGHLGEDGIDTTEERGTHT